MQERVTGRVLVAEATGSGRLVEPVADAAPALVLNGLGTPVDVAPLDDQKLAVCDEAASAS